MHCFCYMKGSYPNLDLLHNCLTEVIPLIWTRLKLLSCKKQSREGSCKCEASSQEGIAWERQMHSKSSLCLKLYDTTPSCFNRAMCSSSNCRYSRRISSVCWPRVGGGVLIPGVAWEYLTGVFTSLIGPQAGCSISLTIPRAWTVALSAAQNTVHRMGTHREDDLVSLGCH